MGKTCIAPWLAFGLVAGLFMGCPCRRLEAGGAGVALKSDGGTMNKVVLQRLGSVSPGRQGDPDKPRPNESDEIDHNPIVLWKANQPAAVVYYRRKTQELLYEQTFAKTTGQGEDTGFWGRLSHGYPIRFRESGEAAEGYGMNDFIVSQIVTADVNGDGVDELILPRARGGIDVYSAEKQLYSFSGESYGLGGYAYIAETSHTVHFKGRDVVFIIAKLENILHIKGEKQPADLAEYAVYRVDHRGVARVALPKKLQFERFTVFGGFYRPGSADVDELLVVGRAPEETGDFLFRYRPDGRPIDVPKEFPVPIGNGIFRFLPTQGGPYAILPVRRKVHFITPDKPINWIKTVDLGLLAEKDDRVCILHVSDPQSDPKLIVSVAKRSPSDQDQWTTELFAVNAEGRCFAPDGQNRGWQPLPNCESYHRITPPSPLHQLVTILPSSLDSDDLLVVHSRKAQTKKLTHDEALAAAGKFLMPREMERFRKQLVVRLDDMRVIESIVADERRSKGIKHDIKTVDEWKRLLPESYETKRMGAESYAFLYLAGTLRLPLEVGAPPSPDMYRNFEEYCGWLREQAIGPETQFTIIRGRSETSWKVGASVAPSPSADVPCEPIDFRSSKNGVNIIFTGDLSTVPEPPVPGLPREMGNYGFFLFAPSMDAL
jgi:hypothetical protein